MRLFHGLCVVLAAVLWLVAGCTPAASEEPWAASAPAAKAATEPTPCHLYCNDACSHAQEPACSYQTSDACLADCLPSCESGDVHQKVAACEGGDQPAPAQDAAR